MSLSSNYPRILGKLSTLLGISISHEKSLFEDDFPFPKVGYVSSLEGNFLKELVETGSCRRHFLRFLPSVQALQKHWPRKNQDAICQEMFGEPRENNNNKMAAQNYEERNFLLLFFCCLENYSCYLFLCFALPFDIGIPWIYSTVVLMI